MNLFKKLFLLFLLGCYFQSCESRNQEIYHCPMHPNYTSDKPGQCPICNMDLVKVESTPRIEEKADHLTHSENIEERFDVSAEETESLKLSSEKQQSIGIKTDYAMKRKLNKELSLYSNVAYDPDLYNALVEYKSANLSSEFLEDSKNGTNQNLDLRLRQLGLSKSQIRLWTSGQRDPTELILGGTKGRGHIYSQIYETELRIAKVGLPIMFVTDVYPDLTFKGSIKSIDTILDRNNRTLRLRSEVSDPNHLLKPQMFGKIVISIPLNRLLTIPTSSILDTGDKKLVYKKISQDRFKSISIKTGIVVGEWTEVKEGLADNDEIVSESTFLIDSEAKIRFGNNTSHKHE